MNKAIAQCWIVQLLVLVLAVSAFTGYRAQPEARGIELHFIDVGDADATLVLADGQAMLVDGGFPESGDMVVEYLKSQGITFLDVVVATHPHNDHMGGLISVLEAFDVGKVYGGAARSERSMQRSFEDAAARKALTVNVPQPGFSFDLGSARVTVLSPSRRYDDLNNMSLVMRVDYGETAFLLQADALLEAEYDMLASGLPLAADVIRVGHHGANDASSKEYLDAVSPDFAVVSCGADKRNRPHKKVMDRLTRAGIDVYRTDMMGTVVARCDGKDIAFYVEFEGDF